MPTEETIFRSDGACLEKLSIGNGLETYILRDSGNREWFLEGSVTSYEALRLESMFMANDPSIFKEFTWYHEGKYGFWIGIALIYIMLFYTTLRILGKF